MTVCPNPIRLAVAPLALPLPAHLHLVTVQQLAVLKTAPEAVVDPAQHRVRDGPEGFADLFLQVVQVRDGLGIHPILDVSPEARMGQINPTIKPCGAHMEQK